MTKAEAKLWTDALVDNATKYSPSSLNWKFYTDWAIAIHREMYPLPGLEPGCPCNLYRQTTVYQYPPNVFLHYPVVVRTDLGTAGYPISCPI